MGLRAQRWHTPHSRMRCGWCSGAWPVCFRHWVKQSPALMQRLNSGQKRSPNTASTLAAIFCVPPGYLPKRHRLTAVRDTPSLRATAAALLLRTSRCSRESQSLSPQALQHALAAAAFTQAPRPSGGYSREYRPRPLWHAGWLAALV